MQLSSPPQPPPLKRSSSSGVTVVVLPSPLADDDVVVVESSARSAEAVQALSIQVGSGGRAVGRKAADKGTDKCKASMHPAFTAGYGPDMPSEEPIITIEMRFKATN